MFKREKKRGKRGRERKKRHAAAAVSQHRTQASMTRLLTEREKNKTKGLLRGEV